MQYVDGNETVFRGPTTIKMISQRQLPPMPMPVQVFISSLFNDFQEMIYAVKPRNYKISAIISYKLLIYFLYFLPEKLRCSLFLKFNKAMLK